VLSLPRSGARSYLIVLGSQISRSPGLKALVRQLRCEGPTRPYPLCALNEPVPARLVTRGESVDPPLDRPGFDVDHTMFRSLTVRSRARSGLGQSEWTPVKWSACRCLGRACWLCMITCVLPANHDEVLASAPVMSYECLMSSSFRSDLFVCETYMNCLS
jgi:hypothetical protein